MLPFKPLFPFVLGRRDTPPLVPFDEILFSGEDDVRVVVVLVDGGVALLLQTNGKDLVYQRNNQQ